MKDSFESRWKEAAAAARSLPQDPPATVPFGFTSRILAQARAAVPPPSLDSLWQLLAGRLLGAMALLLLLLAAVEYARDDDSAPLQPTVEQSIQEQIFSLPS
jgi:hypothetical protein